MISIVVPVYNVEDYIQKCLDSLLSQNYTGEYELILVDDGSKDKSGIICDEYKEKHNNITVLHKENGGLSSARNYGVKYARGEWITFVDSDDYVSNMYLQDLKNLLDKYKADMSAINVRLENSGISDNIPFDDFCLEKADAFYEMYVTKKVGWSACGKLIKRSVLLEHPFPNGYYEEMASLYLLVYWSGRVAFGDYSTDYHYVRREGSITARPFTKKHERIFEVCDEISKFVYSENPDWAFVSVLMYQSAVLQLFNRLEMDQDAFISVFNKYKRLFRRNLFGIIKEKRVPLKSKYYTFILSTSPYVYKMQRIIFYVLKGIIDNDD